MRGEITNQPSQVRLEVPIIANASKRNAERIRHPQPGRVMFYRRTGNAAAFPSVYVEERPELQVGTPEAKILNHPETASKNLTRIDRRAVRDAPVVVRVLDRATDPGGMKLIRLCGGCDEFAAYVTAFPGSPDRASILLNRLVTLRQMIRWQQMIIVHRSDVCALAMLRDEIPVCVKTAARSR